MRFVGKLIIATYIILGCFGVVMVIISKDFSVRMIYLAGVIVAFYFAYSIYKDLQK